MQGYEFKKGLILGRDKTILSETLGKVVIRGNKMSSLAHVCMWINDNWEPITAEKAAELHPGGTVSARSGLFMCELCGQYVILTDGDIRGRYFKHSAYEKSKNCPDRTFGRCYSISYDPHEHELPLRIKYVAPDSFKFELGLIQVPTSLLGKNFQLEINLEEKSATHFVFVKERLRGHGITYLSVGERPFEEYTICFLNGSEELYDFWPKKGKGIDPDGTLFEKISGKKLNYDADVEIGKEYYLLRRGYFYYHNHSSIQIEKAVEKRFGWESWTLYEVKALEFNEESARFFLDFHCRLTAEPVTLQPVWPLYIEDNYLIKHNRPSTCMVVKGNVYTFRTFPHVAIRQLIYNSSRLKLYEVFCNSRQQLISAGRTHALEYTYFWKEPLLQEGQPPAAHVTDEAGHQIASGEIFDLPEEKRLRVRSRYDGHLIVSKNDNEIAKYKLDADTCLEVDDIAFGQSIQVVIGLDVVWRVDFKKRQPVLSDDEASVLGYIVKAPGAIIPIPNSLRNILLGMERYPQICRWIRNCMKNGCINEQSYRRLQNFYLKTKEK